MHICRPEPSFTSTSTWELTTQMNIFFLSNRYSSLINNQVIMKPTRTTVLNWNSSCWRYYACRDYGIYPWSVYIYSLLYLKCIIQCGSDVCAKDTKCVMTAVDKEALHKIDLTNRGSNPPIWGTEDKKRTLWD